MSNMIHYVCRRFSPIARGSPVANQLINSCDDAAAIFGQQVASAYGTGHYAEVEAQTPWHDSNGLAGVTYSVAVFAPGGVLKCEEPLIVTLAGQQG